jgi:co-chaperonin GroES (HSP10)
MYTKQEMPEEIQKKLPKPTGYKLLIATLEVANKTDGGVYLPDQLKDAEQTASIIGFVIDMQVRTRTPMRTSSRTGRTAKWETS